MRLVSLSLSVASLCAVAATHTQIARAQDMPAAAVLETQVAGGVDAGTGGAVDRLIRAELDGLGTVRTSSGVALDLGEVQLALGCVGETPECLGPVAAELSVALLVIPHLDQSGAEQMLTIALFDRRDGSIHRVVRRAQSRPELLDAIEGQLRELFGLPAAVDPEPGPTPTLPPPPSEPDLVPGVTLMVVGAIGLGVGGAMGALHLDAQSEFEAARPSTMAEADAAADALSRSETFAITADVLFAVGGVALAGGLVWLLAEVLSAGGEADSATDTDTDEVTLRPGRGGYALQLEWGTR